MPRDSEFVIPELRIPEAEELEIPNDGNWNCPGLTPDIQVEVISIGTEGFNFTSVTTSPRPGEFQAINNGLKFNANDRGKRVGVIVHRTYSDVPIDQKIIDYCTKIQD